MADRELLARLKQSITNWNQWRREHSTIPPDLSEANLSGANLSEANLSGANLSEADLRYADLRYADLRYADLRKADLRKALLTGAHLFRARLNRVDLRQADLSGARLTEVNLSGALLSEADLSGAHLIRTNLSGAILINTDLSNAIVGETHFDDIDLRTVQGLETVRHSTPSQVSITTIYRSEGLIPETFLQKTGVPEDFLTYMRSLVARPIGYYTCFISYASQDGAFAKRLYTDLQARGVRCWFAPENMKTGDKIRDRIDESIRLYDKLLLVLSQYSVNSSWVEFEVEAALAKENSRKTLMLFPIRLDNAAKESPTSWATHIRRTRHITDFTNWKQHDDYQKVLSRLLRDLKSETPSVTD